MDVRRELEDLIRRYRDCCLWFAPPDYMPGTREEMLRVLDLIERYGDLEAFRRAEEIKAWLLQPSSGRF